MNTEAETATEPVKASAPVPSHVVEMARQAVEDFHECFWFRHPGAEIVSMEDVEIIIDNLRRYGGHRAWQKSIELRSCL